jgi:hypothetical protein
MKVQNLQVKLFQGSDLTALETEFFEWARDQEELELISQHMAVAADGTVTLAIYYTE